MGTLLQILRVINMIPMVIATVESVSKGLPGNDKKKLVQDEIMNALTTSELVMGRDIVDEKNFKKNLQKTVDGIVGMLNNSVWKGK